MQQRGVHARARRLERAGVPVLTEQPLAARFDPEVLADLARELEVDVETVRQDGRPKRTTIWVVVDDGQVFARSWLGDRGIWYRHVRARPDELTLHVAGRAVPVRAISATDDDSVERTSRGFENKYSHSMSTAAMVAPKIAHTTIRFDPR